MADDSHKKENIYPNLYEDDVESSTHNLLADLEHLPTPRDFSTLSGYSLPNLQDINKDINSMLKMARVLKYNSEKLRKSADTMEAESRSVTNRENIDPKRLNNLLGSVELMKQKSEYLKGRANLLAEEASMLQDETSLPTDIAKPLTLSDNRINLGLKLSPQEMSTLKQPVTSPESVVEQPSVAQQQPAAQERPVNVVTQVTEVPEIHHAKFEKHPPIIPIDTGYPVFHIPSEGEKEAAIPEFHKPDPPAEGVNPYEVLTSSELHDSPFKMPPIHHHHESPHEDIHDEGHRQHLEEVDHQEGEHLKPGHNPPEELQAVSVEPLPKDEMKPETSVQSTVNQKLASHFSESPLGTSDHGLQKTGDGDKPIVGVSHNVQAMNYETDVAQTKERSLRKAHVPRQRKAHVSLQRKYEILNPADLMYYQLIE